MHHRCIILLTLAIFGSGSCGRPPIDTTRLHQECPTGACADGQTCLITQTAEGEIKTCEIPCESDFECPETTRCNVPFTAVPGSLVNTCVSAS